MTRQGENENGNYYYNEETNISAFEDTQESENQYYAWRGDYEAHDNATQSPVFNTIDEAVQWIEENVK